MIVKVETAISGGWRYFEAKDIELQPLVSESEIGGIRIRQASEGGRFIDYVSDCSGPQMKALVFVSGDIKYFMVTSLQAYLMSDTGETINRLN